MTGHGALLVGIGLDQACIHCKTLAAHQTLSHAAAHDDLKHMAQDVALAEPTVTVAGEGGMIWNLTIKPQAAEPAIGQIQVNLFA
jgi:hypothetical protein